MDNKLHIQEAIKDLAVIRQAMERAENEEKTAGSVLNVSLGAHLVLQAMALAVSSVVIVTELATNNLNTQVMLLSSQSAELRAIGLIETAFMLSTLVVTLYFVVRRAAKDSDRDFNYYITRNFTYLRNTSFLSDLFVKFTVFAALILAQKPEWVAPMFLIFTGDYLLQGRFFRLPVTWNLLLGSACFLGGFIQFLYSSALLLYPFVAVALISASSIYHLNRERKSLQSTVGDNS
jgi:hypothetical protein